MSMHSEDELREVRLDTLLLDGLVQAFDRRVNAQAKHGVQVGGEVLRDGAATLLSALSMALLSLGQGSTYDSGRALKEDC